MRHRLTGAASAIASLTPVSPMRSTGPAASRHHNYVRLSFAEQSGTLELAAERLAAAWESRAADLAAAPTAPAGAPPVTWQS